MGSHLNIWYSGFRLEVWFFEVRPYLPTEIQNLIPAEIDLNKAESTELLKFWRSFPVTLKGPAIYPHRL
jgi:hypothetical protein